MLQNDHDEHHGEKGLVVSLAESDVDKRTEEIDAICGEKLDLNVVIEFCVVSVVFLVVEENDATFHQESYEFDVDGIYNCLPI